MTSYHLFGLLSSVLFLVMLAIGFGHQVWLIVRRKAEIASGTRSPHTATESLSTNYVATIFLTFYFFFVYGLSTKEIVHYIVWPRLAAALVAVWLLAEIARDRNERRARYFASGAAVLLGLVVLA
ncbi:MAG: hypothetical protein KDD44_03545, partial [Bdellovibrionales bacterium]|nr:hypothetical protein [Bdellovibrionales bacterium]